MAARTTLGANPTGLELREHMNARIKTLFDGAHFPLSDVGGTVNAVTATLDPPLDGDGLIEGMLFSIVWADANTDAVTLSINGGTAVAVLDVDGSALGPGALQEAMASLLRYTGSDFRILTRLSVNSATGRYSWQITANTTWTPPDNLSEDTPVYVQAWGGGGGGATSNGGGGGGAYTEWTFRLGDLGSSVTCTIGAGGASDTAGEAGGNTTFGSFLTAYGGTGGSAGGGGLGASEFGTTLPKELALDGGGSYFLDIHGGGYPGADGSGNGGPATQRNAGGAGGFGSGVGGAAICGGGGGGGGTSSAGGVSLYGGNGGNGGSAGVAPGGGGGRGAAGARGEIRIWI